jgi:hypothetical protein
VRVAFADPAAWFGWRCFGTAGEVFGCDFVWVEVLVLGDAFEFGGVVVGLVEDAASVGRFFSWACVLAGEVDGYDVECFVDACIEGGGGGVPVEGT